MPIPAKTPLIALMRLEAKHVAALNKILAVAIADLDKQIKKMGSDNPITIMQAKAQREAMNDFMNRTFDSMEDVARAGMSEAAVAASRVVSQYEDELLKLVLDKSTMANLAKSEANRAAAGLNAALKRMQGTSYVPLSKTVYKTKQLASGWVDDLINKALASGWSRQRLAKELRQSIDPKVPGGVSYAANRTARTEINNAFHAVSADRYMNSVIVEGVDWHLSSSHPEGDICDQLEADSPYPKKEVPKKPHPNCYCYITPHLPTEDEFLDNLFAGKYDDGAPWAGEAKSGKQIDPRWTLGREFIGTIMRPGGPMFNAIAPDGSDLALADIWRAQGYMNKPRMVTDIDMDDVNTIHRGVRDIGPTTADDMVRQFKSGDEAFAGTGIYGNGSYFSDDASTAIGYAGGQAENVLHARWAPGAVTHEFPDSYEMQMWMQAKQAEGMQVAKEAHEAGDLTDDEFRALRGMWMDPGRAASMMGIDGYSITIYGREKYWVVLNRSALEVQE